MNAIFAKTIECWYEQNKRELPWRETRDPYHIWISEIILQQTRVAQGYDYYLRFIQRFPDVFSLAAAQEDEVLLLWQGLGYYSRARNLHKAAQQIAAIGAFPTEYEDIRSLAGIGDYTAAAIASFAYDLPYAVLDGNVYRVLSRYLGIDTPIDTTRGKHDFTALAAEMLDRQHPALYNQAIMDFGAMVCTPAATSCPDCPLVETCCAARDGRVSDLPIKSKKTKVRDRYLIYIYVRAQGNVLLHRRSNNDIWAGMYEPLLLPDFEPKTNRLLTCFKMQVRPLDSKFDSKMPCKNQNSPKEESDFQANSHPLIASALASGASLTCVCTDVKHQLSHQLLHADFYLLECSSFDIFSPSLLSENGLIVVPECERENYATPRLLLELYKKLTFLPENL